MKPRSYKLNGKSEVVKVKKEIFILFALKSFSKK